jgi:hypothetical protein
MQAIWRDLEILTKTVRGEAEAEPYLGCRPSPNQGAHLWLLLG